VKRAGARFIVIYNIPDEFRHSEEGVGRWNALSWSSQSWAERLSAFNLIGREMVDVRAYDTAGQIQYSVFGNRYVLLQEKHSDARYGSGSAPKRVWLLRSVRVNEHLAARASGLALAAYDLPEALFRRFSTRVNGITCRAILGVLARKHGEVPVSQVIDRVLRAFDAEPEKSLDILKAAGFVRDGVDASLCLTQSGHDYLSRTWPAAIAEAR
jgi:hypothetical protein